MKYILFSSTLHITKYKFKKYDILSGSWLGTFESHFQKNNNSINHIPSWQANCIAAIQEHSYHLWVLTVHYHVHKITPLVHILNQLSPFHTITPVSWNHCILIISLTPGQAERPNRHLTSLTWPFPDSFALLGISMEFQAHEICC